MAMAGTRRGRSLTQHLPFALVLLVVAVAALRVAQYHWREGAGLIGGALLLAGLLRAVDVLTYGALAVLILFVALTITGGPLSSS